MPVTSIVNGVDLDRLSGTIDAVTADPARARFQFRAVDRLIDGGDSRTTIKGFDGAGQEDVTRTQPFTVDSDEPPVLLGQNQAPNACEFLLRPRGVPDRHDRLRRRRPRHRSRRPGNHDPG